MDDHLSGIASIKKRQARSGNLSISDPVVLHDSQQSRITMMPFYIKRSSGETDLSVKITTFKKRKPPHNWLEMPEKTLNLNETAARKLLGALNQHLAVAEHNQDGSYIAIKLTNGVADVKNIEPSIVAKAVMSMLKKEDIVQHLELSEIGSEIIGAFRTSIRLQEMKSAVEILRQNLDGGVYDEQTYQKWCEEHSWAFGNAYVVRDNIRQISPGDNLDLLLPSVLSGYRDLVELKRPNMDVLVYDKSHRNYYFSSEVSKAIGQCHRYLDVLSEEAARGLRDHPEIVAYHPRATIVIGRSAHWDEKQLKALHGLNCRLNGMSVMTYDQLLLQGDRLLDLFTSTLNDDNDDEFESNFF